MFRGMFGVLCCALVCSAASAGDTIVQEGDYFPELWVTEGGLQMTGGQVDRFVLWGSGPYEITGGSVGRMDVVSGELLSVRSGGRHSVIRTDRFGGYPDELLIDFVGRYFRVYDAGRPERNSYIVEGWSENGEWVRAGVSNQGEYDTESLPLKFTIVPGDRPSGDVDLDWDVDLSDLNSIRNDFGGPGQGDLDGNGAVDLEDLNRVRNNFGAGEFTLTHDNPGSFPFLEITETTSFPLPPAAVPEPSSLLLALLSLTLFAKRGWLRP